MVALCIRVVGRRAIFQAFEDRGFFARPRLTGLAACALFACLAGPGWAQKSPSPRSGDRDVKSSKDEVVVTGERGSAVTDIAPIATYDSRDLDAIGATSIGELLRIIGPAAKGPDGKDPIYLLNAQRISGFEEISTLPPEAILKVEIMPQEAALKFGYPPTQRLMNFITKAVFRALDVSANSSRATEGGGGVHGANATLTRLRNGRRLTLGTEYSHTDPLLQSQRPIAPDPTNPFDGIGNVMSATGGEIDPALSAAAGHPVFVAAVPSDPAERGQLAAYVAGAGQLRSFDLGPYRTLVSREDRVKGNAVLATPLTSTISGSFTLTAEHKISRSLQGLPSAAILLPAASPYSPFADDVLLYRYLADQPPLVQHSYTTTLHGGALLRGAIADWQWDATATLDSNDVRSRGDRGVDIGGIDRAVADGADPFGALDPVRLKQQSHTRTRKGEVKAVAGGVAMVLPGGELRVTATGEAERSTVDTHARGYQDVDIALGRTRVEGGLSFDIPLASKDADFLPFFGKLSASLSANVRDLSDAGTLSDTSYGLTWEPVTGLEFGAMVKHQGIAPDMAQKSAPTQQGINIPYFDFRTGQTVYVTTISGGNPALRAEQSRTTTLSLNWKPSAERQLTFALHYSMSVARNMAQSVSEFPKTEDAFPDRFVRDEAGRLTTVFLNPTNLYRSERNVLQGQFNWNGPIGKPPAKPDPHKPAYRPYFYMGTVLIFYTRNRVELRPGLPALDVLAGDSYDGSARNRAAVYSWGGVGYRGSGFSLSPSWIGPARIDGGLSQTDLHFSSRLLIDTKAFVTLGAWIHEKWARKFTITVQAENLLDDHRHVRDATGATPNRYQPAYLDPLGRTVKLTLRKLF